MLDRMEITLNTERDVDNLNFNLSIDHAWLYISGNLHAKLLLVIDNKIKSDAIKEITENKDGSILIIPDNKYKWSDGEVLTTKEVIKALWRGEKFYRGGLFEKILDNKDSIIILPKKGKKITKTTFTNHYFTLTPCLHDRGNHTLGPYYLSDINYSKKNKRILVFNKSVYHPRIRKTSPDKIKLMTVEESEDEISMLRSSEIDISRPLGLAPKVWADNKSERIGIPKKISFYVYLTGLERVFKKNTKLYKLIDSSLDRNEIAKVVGDTMEPCTREFNTSRNFPKIDHRCIDLYYTNYHPNKLIAFEVSRQIKSNLGITLNPTVIDYTKLINYSYDNLDGLFIDILNECPSMQKTDTLNYDQVLLLQCKTLFLKNFNLTHVNFDIFNDGVIDWSSIEIL